MTNHSPEGRGPSDLEERAWLALERDDFEGALRLARELNAGSPADPSGPLLEGLSLRALGEPAKALQALGRAVERTPGPCEAEADRVEVLLQDLDEPAAALAASEAALARRPEPPLKARLLQLAGDVLLRTGKPGAALERYDAAARLGPDLDDPEARGAALFELGELRRSAAALRRSLRDPGQLSGRGHFLLGVALERLHDVEGAARHLAAARHLEPEIFCAPLEVPAEAVRARIQELLAALPAPLKDPLAGVPVVLDAWPELADLRASTPPLSPLVPGLLRGPSLRERVTGDDPPTQIVLYQRNLELLCEGLAEFDERLRATLWQQICRCLSMEDAAPPQGAAG